MSGTTVGAGSSSVPLFQRRYCLDVTTDSGDNVLTLSDSDWEPEALRVVFEVHQVAAQGWYWNADIDIYNPSLGTVDSIQKAAIDITQGMKVVLQAGYVGSQYGTIWSGNVFQAQFSREHVVDFKIRLRCILSLQSKIAGTPQPTGAYPAGASQLEIVQSMIKSLGLQQDSLSSKISTAKLPRGYTYVGSPDRVLTQIAKDADLLWWLGFDGICMGKPGEDDNGQTLLTYTPDTGLVGSPVQTQQGVDFTVLLDPRLKVQRPFIKIKLDQTLIQQFNLQIGSLPPLPLNQFGEYYVGAVHHHGDSRGNPWYSDVTAYSTQWDALQSATINLI